MSPFFAVFLVLLLSSSSYAAGRLHGQLSYRFGYRCGYRQGYLDGDRGAWHRRRRDAQPTFSSVLAVSSPPAPGALALTAGGLASPGGRAPSDLAPGAVQTVVGQGTTYTGASFAGTATNGGRHAIDAFTGGNV